jgi:hypothetical protein
MSEFRKQTINLHCSKAVRKTHPKPTIQTSWGFDHLVQGGFSKWTRNLRFTLDVESQPLIYRDLPVSTTYVANSTELVNMTHVKVVGCLQDDRNAIRFCLGTRLFRTYDWNNLERSPISRPPPLSPFRSLFLGD